MAAGVNYNNVWAAMGIPIDVIKTRQKKGEAEDFHIGGSDASGVVWATGSAVTNVKVGDEVVVHCGMWAPGRSPRGRRQGSDAGAVADHLGLRVELGQRSRSTPGSRTTSACPSRRT
jgi:NADPH:quinone reductase-like Zn-dependent oxidoreductase